MKRTRLWLVTGFTMLLSLGFLLTRGDAKPSTVKKIADGVWFREGHIKGQGHCNNAIIEMIPIITATTPTAARSGPSKGRLR